MNTQPKMHREADPQAPLYLNSIFDTMQGEGPSAGVPATFIRLAGCNLQCQLCDTEYRTENTLNDIAGAFLARYLRPLVVITGGEPFRQPHALKRLLDVITVKAGRIEIETNGTYDVGWTDIYSNVRIICAPKLGTVHKSILTCASAWKILIDSRRIQDGWPVSTLGGQPGNEGTVGYRDFLKEELRKTARPVYIHPEDVSEEYKGYKFGAESVDIEEAFDEIHQYRLNQKAAVDFVKRNPTFRLGLQLHKYYDLA